jgi:pimeloyl-ACP methyl ester carboxylesterase/catechol 2,3-dioxygenase-like lactoylglutathione lyase family enzyme
MMAANFTSRFVTVNGLRLRYLDFGGSGPPAVLHHGTGFHGALWAPIAAQLAERYHVLALDARGHGDSEPSRDGYAWDGFVSDLIGFSEALGLSSVLGIGHSLGATTTSVAASRRPDLYRALVLLEPIVFPSEERPLGPNNPPIADQARKRREHWSNREEALRSYRGRGPFAKWPDEVLRLYVDHGFADEEDGVRLKCAPAVEGQVFSMDRAFDCWSTFERIQAPTLLMRGGESDVLSPQDAARAVEHLRRGKLHTLPGTSHTLPMEQPQGVASAILEFADSVLPIATRGMAHLALNVVALEATVRFYSDVFGMRIVWQPDPDNVYLSSGRDNLALHRASEPRAERGSPLDHLGFFVESADRVFALAETLRGAGVPIVQEPRNHRDGSSSVYVRDPDGNVVQVLHEPNVLRS